MGGMTVSGFGVLRGIGSTFIPNIPFLDGLLVLQASKDDFC